MVLGAAWVTCRSPLRSSARFRRRLDLSSGDSYRFSATRAESCAPKQNSALTTLQRTTEPGGWASKRCASAHPPR